MAGNYVRDETPRWEPTPEEIRIACDEIKAAHLEKKRTKWRPGTEYTGAGLCSTRQPVNTTKNWNRRPYSTP